MHCTHSLALFIYTIQIDTLCIYTFAIAVWIVIWFWKTEPNLTLNLYHQQIVTSLHYWFQTSTLNKLIEAGCYRGGFKINCFWHWWVSGLVLFQRLFCFISATKRPEQPFQAGLLDLLCSTSIFYSPLAAIPSTATTHHEYLWYYLACQNHWIFYFIWWELLQPVTSGREALKDSDMLKVSYLM